MLTPNAREMSPTPRGIDADDTLRQPRRQPYHRASQRELVRASLRSYLHTHAYDREDDR